MTEGALILVATPIGNLSDISSCALEVLSKADVVACEDTRHSCKLLTHYGIKATTIAVHEHNELAISDSIVQRIREGLTVAMVTDAGMPAISDPGERVVAAVAAAGLTVSVIPGASAVPAALAVSGLPTDRFCFEGFLPSKNSDRQQRVSEIATEVRTILLYEAPHRLAKTIGELLEACGPDRRVVLVRELTKLHEEIWRGTLSSLAERLAASSVKGECVLVLAGAPAVAAEVSDDEIVAVLGEAAVAGMSKKDAASFVAAQLSVQRNRVYKLAVR